jgi:hypothetical protein
MRTVDPEVSLSIIGMNLRRSSGLSPYDSGKFGSKSVAGSESSTPTSVSK